MGKQDKIIALKNAYKNRLAYEPNEASEIVIEALEKQIAKKPNYEGDGYDKDGNIIYDTWYCPCCNSRFEVDYDDWKYCPDCGQKIDWSEENE